jgi:SAM-dependent methyltransferase
MSIDYYEREADEYIHRTLHVDMTPIYARFLARLPAGGFILDAGCGSGRDARAFLDRGYHVAAFDASPRMASHATSLTKMDVPSMTFADIRWKNRFDGIWCCASLLHVPTNEFEQVARKLLRALKPGGVWYLSFKLGTGQQTRGERLFVDHNEQSLRGALGSLAAVTEIETWVTADRRPGRGQSEAWINALAVKQSGHSASRK